MKGLKIAAIVVAAVALVVGVFALLRSVGDQDYFKIGPDRVPTPKFVFGEKRDSVHVADISYENGVSRQHYAYATNSKGHFGARDSAFEYASYLTEQAGFYHMTDYDFTADKGEARLGKNSAEAGYAVVCVITYTSGRYDIELIRGEGSVTPTSGG